MKNTEDRKHHKKTFIEIAAAVAAFFVDKLVLSWYLPYLRNKRKVNQTLNVILLTCFITWWIIWVSWLFLIFGPGIPEWLNNFPAAIISYIYYISTIGSLIYTIKTLRNVIRS